MDDQAPPETPAKDFNKIDLTQLQGFSFGTQWTQDKAGAAREPRREDRPRREDGGMRENRGPANRDRRAFRRPAGDAPANGGGEPGGSGGEHRPGGQPSGDPRDAGRPQRRGGEFRGENRGGPGGDRGQWRGAPIERGPYDSPYFTATFYPEDASFTALARTIRASCRTFELFEIARTVIGKADRFVVVVQRKVAGEGQGAAAPKPAPVFLSVPDGMPFDTEAAAISHVLEHHLSKFFEVADVEIEPPKGNFQVVNRCGITGDLLGPPNYHLYGQICQRHHAAKVNRMSFEAFRSRIETVRDQEAINQWLQQMKKATRYTWKPAGAVPAAAPVAPATEAGTTAPEAGAPAPEAAAPAATPTETAAAPAPAPGPAAAPAAEAAPSADAPTFFSLDDARAHLISTAKDKAVRPVEHARFHGKLIETLPQGEIRRAVEGTLERQRRFPLDTANALRGRLRRERFTIFKKGSKGVSYVCAVKRRFRVPGQVFADSIGNLISFIEANPMVKASELPVRFLQLALPAEQPPAAGDAPVPAAHPAPLSLEDRARLTRLQGDLAWLVHEGYVTEFIDGRLFAPPPMVEARKKEIEATEHDPENFPDQPPAEQQSAPVAEQPAAEQPATPEPVAEAAVTTEETPPTTTSV